MEAHPRTPSRLDISGTNHGHSPRTRRTCFPRCRPPKPLRPAARIMGTIREHRRGENRRNQTRSSQTKISQLLSPQSLVLNLNRMPVSVSGPEKAGVGGSIPSLATFVFNNLQTSLTLVCSIWFHIRIRARRLCLLFAERHSLSSTSSAVCFSVCICRLIRLTNGSDSQDLGVLRHLVKHVMCHARSG